MITVFFRLYVPKKYRDHGMGTGGAPGRLEAYETGDREPVLRERCSWLGAALWYAARVNASRTARERVRAELTREITEIARRQLATEGAAGLSLRAVAREMGMVSSAIYRYFSSRDKLLTALIIEGYDAVGAAVEQAEGGCPRQDYPGRWLAVCQAIRGWALAHPHEYALIYGSPVPGYQAPEETVVPAGRVAAVLGKIVSDAYRADGDGSGAGGDGLTAGGGGLAPGDGPAAGGGGLAAGQAGPGGEAAAEPGPPGSWKRPGAQSAQPGEPGWWPAVPGSFAPDANRLRETVLPGVPDGLAARSLAVWASVFGLVSFELFGQFENVVTERDEFFRCAAAALGTLVGLRTQPGPKTL
jgi:AcrR family transcriptional regulator